MSTFPFPLEGSHLVKLYLSFFQMFPKPLRTLDAYVLVKKASVNQENPCTIKEAYFIGLLKISWYKEGISPNSMGQEVNLFTGKSLRMKTSSISMMFLVYSQWLMLERTRMGHNSLLQLWNVPGLMVNTLSSEKWKIVRSLVVCSYLRYETC